MCGICGKINRDPEKPIDQQLIHEMCQVIKHRGPDDDGFFFHKNIGLGMRRLSIIDLSTGKQPIYNEDGTIAVVLNGEIYNFQDLRTQLIAKGHRFKTRSDTEAIVHLFEDKGEACVHDLRGMFGFAVYDKKMDKLMVARDRMGIKPIYYAFDHDKLLFGSELKSLLRDRSLDTEFDYFALNCYFSFMNTIAPDTIFKNVRKLMPGQYFVYEKGQFRVEQYWRFSLNENTKLTEAECREQLMELLKDSVRIRLISDVPLGAFLSGGIDSSTVVALMSQVSDQPVKTFSIGFESRKYDELEYAKQVATRFNTDHHEYVVNPDVTEIIDDLIWYLDEPFSDPSAIPTYFVSKIARENVTVALSGDGGDEMFGGYLSYNAEAILNKVQKIPRFLRNGLIRNILTILPATPYAKFNEEKERLKRILDRVDLTPEERFFSRHHVFNTTTKKLLYSEDLKSQLNGHFDIEQKLLSYLDPPKNGASINKMLYLDTHLYLPNDMLVKVDRMSMATSLEARVPLLDHKLVEFVSTIPWNLKVKGTVSKYILKKTMSDLLPHNILYRKKQGFNMPLNEWFRNDLVGLAAKVLLDRTSVHRGLFNRDHIERLLTSHQQKAEDMSFQIWSLIVFEKWCRTFIDKKG